MFFLEEGVDMNIRTLGCMIAEDDNHSARESKMSSGA